VREGAEVQIRCGCGNKKVYNIHYFGVGMDRRFNASEVGLRWAEQGDGRSNATSW
jgi:hypothetical protein